MNVGLTHVSFMLLPLIMRDPVAFVRLQRQLPIKLTSDVFPEFAGPTTANKDLQIGNNGRIFNKQ